MYCTNIVFTWISECSWNTGQMHRMDTHLWNWMGKLDILGVISKDKWAHNRAAISIWLHIVYYIRTVTFDPDTKSWVIDRNPRHAAQKWTSTFTYQWQKTPTQCVHPAWCYACLVLCLPSAHPVTSSKSCLELNVYAFRNVHLTSEKPYLTPQKSSPYLQIEKQSDMHNRTMHSSNVDQMQNFQHQTAGIEHLIKQMFGFVSFQH